MGIIRSSVSKMMILRLLRAITIKQIGNVLIHFWDGGDGNGVPTDPQIIGGYSVTIQHDLVHF